MKFVVTGQDHLFGPWWAEKSDTVWVPGKGHTVGLLSEGRGIVACGYFESYNGASVLCHIASEGKNWMNREFLWFFFYYPFEQLKVKKLLCIIDETNIPSVRLAQSCGFTLEATLKDACPKGDMLVFSMEKSACKWLTLKDRRSGKTESTEGA